MNQLTVRYGYNTLIIFLTIRHADLNLWILQCHLRNVCYYVVCIILYDIVVMSILSSGVDHYM